MTTETIKRQATTKEPAATVKDAPAKNEMGRPAGNGNLPPLARLRREFEALWNKFFNEPPALWHAERADGRWDFGVEDYPEAYVVKAEAPGFDVQDFQIDLRGDQLVMQAKQMREKKDPGEETFTASEFYHAMTLPPHVDPKKIEAEYKAGVLTVTLPKTAAGKGRQIPVKG